MKCKLVIQSCSKHSGTLSNIIRVKAMLPTLDSVNFNNSLFNSRDYVFWQRRNLATHFKYLINTLILLQRCNNVASFVYQCCLQHIRNVSWSRNSSSIKDLGFTNGQLWVSFSLHFAFSQQSTYQCSYNHDSLDLNFGPLETFLSIN